MRSNKIRAGARYGLVAVALLLWLALTPAAQAGKPSHPGLPDPIGGYALSHACGTATDSKGDIYVANAAESKVEVFNPSGAHLTSIEDTHEPCALAVDTAGRLYVSERALGKVVRYTPNAYPFSGTPTYGAPVTIDASGNAKGIAVDPTDDSLYVAEGSHISYYQSDGTLGINEVQRVSVESTTTGGTFTLTFAGQTTAAIPYNASAAAVQSALEALSNLAPGDVVVSGGPGATSPYKITFAGAYAHADVAQIKTHTSLSPNEVEKLTINATGGTFTLKFEHGKNETTAPIPYNASAGELKAALEALTDIGSGNVSVTGGPGGPGGSNPYFVEFVGEFAGTNPGELVPNSSALSGSASREITIFGAGIRSETLTQGFSGQIGEGILSGATGVAAVEIGSNRYVSVAEPSEGEVHVLSGSDVRTLEERATIDGSETPVGELGLAAESYLGADPKTGHVFSYDATDEVLDEFEATGHYFTRIVDPAFADAGSTAIAVDRSGGATKGRVYVTAGAGSGAKLLAFGPVEEPSRALFEEPHEPHSFSFTKACGTVVDSHGDLYVAGESVIRVYGSSGSEITHINDSGKPCSLALDSKGNLYAADLGALSGGDEKVVVFEPSAYPPTASTTYAKNPAPIEELENPRSLAVDLGDDHLFVTHDNGVREYKSAEEGSGLVDSHFCGLGKGSGVDVYGADGDVYVASPSLKAIIICNASGTKQMAQIDGSGSPGGAFGSMENVSIAVDQSNGHVLVGEMESRGVVEEYEASGAFVARFGNFQEIFQTLPADLAIDNSGGPSEGNLYVAYDAPTGFDLTAFSPLTYGEPPLAATGTATGVGGGGATLNGTVDPRGVELEECVFEWGEAGQPFEHTEPCAETPAQIGEGENLVPVHLDLSGLNTATTRYHFRLLATNKFGSSEGEEAVFGRPLVSDEKVLPTYYSEATLRTEVDPFGLETEYHFEYLTEGEYLENGETFAGAKDTSTGTLSAVGGEAEVDASVGGLGEGTNYVFRLVAANEAGIEETPAQSFETLERLHSPPCSNETLRLENGSASLPNCRAYELVTPADTRDAIPRAAGGEPAVFNDWLTTPTGPLTGDSLAFYLTTTLPDTEGNGAVDGLRATRGAEGWGSELFSPTYVEKGDGARPLGTGVSADQLYSFWEFGAATPPGAFPFGHYLRTPGGSPEPSPHCAVEAEPQGRFEVLGCGSLGQDLNVEEDFISFGAAHVIFTTRTTVGTTAVQLEPGAPSPPVGAIYDRSPGGPTRVVSLLPGDITPASNATYLGANEEGSVVVFSVAGKMYVRIDDAETVKATDGPASFAGISEDGSRVFYTDKGNPSEPAGLWECDVSGGSCAATEIVANGKFVDVSPDGSQTYFTSEEPIGGEGASGAHNLYAWSGGATKLVAELSANDLFQVGKIHFPGTNANERVALDSWVASCVLPAEIFGRADCPARTSPDGRFLVFQSHADLTLPYEGSGHSEVYRYDAEKASLLCVSCDPSGASAGADVDLQAYGTTSPTIATDLIPGVSADGKEVFFQTEAQLLPEDANSVTDVYEWQAEGAGGCTRVKGCLSLISSGQGDSPSQIYSMTPDGHDVFFETQEKLIGSDIPGSPSIYDARVEGGFPQPRPKQICHGDACQPPPEPEPERPAIGTGVPNSGNATEPPAPRCRKGQRKVRRNGSVRCVRRHHHKRRAAR